MKKLFRDYLIFLFSIIGIVFLYTTYMRIKGPLVRIIAFHYVSNITWFEKVIVMLVSQYNVITPQQFIAREFDAKKINVLITFDDGYQSWIDVCVPVLKKYNLKAPTN